MTSTSIYSIYKFTNKINSKSYIGKTIDIPTRYSKHKKIAESGLGFAIHNAIRKYGIDNFTFEIIFQANNTLITEKTFTDIFENYFIKECRSHVTEHGYNLTWGGEGFDKESQKFYADKRTAEGKNPFSGGMIQSKKQQELVMLGEHNFQGSKMNEYMLLNNIHPSQNSENCERISIREKQKIANGTHVFQSEKFKKNQSKIQHELVASGKHHLLSGEIQSKSNKTRLEKGEHPSQFRVCCLYCQKETDLPNHKRWHGSNCKKAGGS
jgi:group I intron endonuclease